MIKYIPEDTSVCFKSLKIFFKLKYLYLCSGNLLLKYREFENA